MCGHVGIAGNISFKEEKMFREMLKLDTIRGHHATGVTSLRTNFQTKQLETLTTKKAVDAFRFLSDKVSDELFKPVNYMLLGHNRHATRGAIVDENSHPFEFPNIVGAHNGSLTTYDKMHNAKSYDVDSEALYSELNENGVDSMWEKTNGAASLVWYNRADKTLNMLRNNQRPMVYAIINKGKTLVWASEAWIIFVAAGRADVELGDVKPIVTTVNQLYTFKFPSSATDKGGVEVTTRSVKPYVAPVYTPKVYDYYWNNPEKKSNLLEKENIKLNGEILFTVDKLNDYFSGQVQRTAVEGKTENGTPIRIFAVDTDRYEEILQSMWDNEGQIFCGRVIADTPDYLVIGILSVVDCCYTLEDLAIAEYEAELKAEKESYQITCCGCKNKTSVYHQVGNEQYCQGCYNAKKSLH